PTPRPFASGHDTLAPLRLVGHSRAHIVAYAPRHSPTIGRGRRALLDARGAVRRRRVARGGRLDALPLLHGRHGGEHVVPRRAEGGDPRLHEEAVTPGAQERCGASAPFSG